MSENGIPTILLVDDEESLRLLYAEELSAEGYEVFTAENGKEGLRQVELVKPDLIILDIVMPVMAVPVNREVELMLRSKDVIHDFFCPQLRIKQDAVPGLAIRIHFTANRIGEYEVACAELCGLGHYRMRTTLTVMSDGDYQKWLKDNSPH